MGETDRKTKKIYYSMGEVSEMFDVNPSLIRFWEQKFSILKPEKNKKGNRLFTQQDVDNLKLIYHLVKENGMTLAGAQKRLKENREGLERNLEIIERLQAVKSLLLEVRQELKESEMNAGTILVENESEPDLSRTDLPETMQGEDNTAANSEFDAGSDRVADLPAQEETDDATQPQSAGSPDEADPSSELSALPTGPREQPLFPDYVEPERPVGSVNEDESGHDVEAAAQSDPAASELPSEESASTGKRMRIVEQTLF